MGSHTGVVINILMPCTHVDTEDITEWYICIVAGCVES